MQLLKITDVNIPEAAASAQCNRFDFHNIRCRNNIDNEQLHLEDRSGPSNE